MCNIIRAEIEGRGGPVEFTPYKDTLRCAIEKVKIEIDQFQELGIKAKFGIKSPDIPYCLIFSTDDEPYF